MIEEAIYTLLGSKNRAGNRGIHMAELTLPLAPPVKVPTSIMPGRGKACLDKIKQIFNIVASCLGRGLVKLPAELKISWSKWNSFRINHFFSDGESKLTSCGRHHLPLKAATSWSKLHMRNRRSTAEGS